ncbi:MAG: MBL fold metallo-hydrolase [Gammaproteobacteria bacterium]|nr:MBL fold metallo-hydrolase [Gammaproteobacteria bacterium]MDH4255792.1 MBL fold metallo-hydrolase [Gammaproteobacteria bacterium]MDH5309235.1 MBL fold metallo-hydrolase [Gammaproteobacteria bacterium]
MSAARSFVFLLLASGRLAAAETASALYLGNEGLLITQGEVKILFDPLADNTFGQYELLPPDMRAMLFDGRAPFDGVDAIFVSHYHGDHFSASLMRDYLAAQPGVRLYAPLQAVAALREVLPEAAAPMLARVTGLALEAGEPPIRIDADGLRVEAVRIPHSGWPDRQTHVENLAFRVTLADGITVLHMGDADTRPEHFRGDADYWAERPADMAFPPYWYFESARGRQVLTDYLRPVHAVGIHVPDSVPDDPARRDPELQGYDLFTRPGETRTPGGTQQPTP